MKKTILIIAEHILFAVAAICFIWVLSGHAVLEERLLGNDTKKYCDSAAFEQQMYYRCSQVLQGLNGKRTMETEGQYDPDKIVDIKQYYETQTIGGTDVSGLAYRMGDLINWHKDYSLDAGEYPDDAVIVCRKTDGTFRYYAYSEFEKLIVSGELNILRNEPEYVMSVPENLKELLDLGGFTEDFAGILDKNGEMIYIDCWVFDEFALKDFVPTVSGKTILDIVNSNPEWNGKLSDIYNMLSVVIQMLGEKYGAYLDMHAGIEEGDSNYSYLYADTENGAVYTNVKKYEDYASLEKSLQDIKKRGKYVIATPLLNGFDSNMKDAEAEVWRDEVKYGAGKEEGFIFAAAVDTTFPIHDRFYTENRVYESFASSIVAVSVTGLLAFLLAIAGLVWLTFLTEGLNRFDKWKTELAAVFVFAVWFIVIRTLGFMLVNDWLGAIGTLRNVGEAIPYMIMGAGIAIFTCAMFLTGYLSLVRRIKAKTVWSNSLLKTCVDFAKKIFDNIGCVWKIIVLFGGFIVIHWMTILTRNHFFLIIIMLAAELAVFVYLVYYVLGRERLIKGISQISNGEIDYKIPIEKMTKEQKSIAKDINRIGEGLEYALEKSMKSERLKTDLITNVSHDIKTPLTSIINYVNLLKQENFEDPKVQHYLEILDAKAQRLKILTEDVVEASKISSGNIHLEFINLNFAEMLQQTSGEFAEKFEVRGLKEILSLPNEEAVIRADGRRMWRILENIYNNVAKYAMPGTRVYADLKVKDGRVIFSLKNVSEQPLNISAEELTERFIRGDISRSTEGSGLGLSIAKNLTEMQGGIFEIYLDGDLFKVTISFLGTG